MLSGEYEAILEELGRELGIANLRPDQHNTCLLRLPGDINVYIEMEKGNDYLIIGSDFGEIPPGRYREDLFAAALKSNALPYPKVGIFAFSEKTSSLAMYDRLWCKGLNGVNVADFLAPFAEKVKIWKEAIATNEVPAVSQITTSDRQAGIFGLRP
ncbi:MAG: CesT family type III secretion system chaperone [Chlamydiales bacterium]|nr:CesT family type III secretion system chaperone [Chlamydiia bacterium]MCP5507234.1 CesT family type III secretion system chaperone [Chlamydiales bacterium]